MFLHHAQIQKIGKASSLKVFWSKETKELKQDSQNELQPPIILIVTILQLYIYMYFWTSKMLYWHYLCDLKSWLSKQNLL
jgi:hypothetical protein